VLRIRNLAEFYSISRDQWDSVGAQSLLKYKSRSELLSVAFPDHEWLPWKFSNMSPSEWKDPALRRRFLAWCASAAGAESGSPADDDLMQRLRQMTLNDYQRHGGSTLLQEYGNSIEKMLKAEFPDRSVD
jgi:hypothetical protein